MYSMKKYLLLFLCLTLGVAYARDTLRVRVMTYNLRFGELASLEELAHHTNLQTCLWRFRKWIAKQTVSVPRIRRGRILLPNLPIIQGCLGFTEKRLTILPVITVLGC